VATVGVRGLTDEIQRQAGRLLWQRKRRQRRYTTDK